MSRVELLRMTANPVEVIAHAARTCTNRVHVCDEGKEKDLEISMRCLWLQHKSVFEHVTFTVDLINISRACADQLLRHRKQTASVQSQRYVNLAKNDDAWKHFCYPDVPEPALKIIQNHVANTKKDYKALIDMGVKCEDARVILGMGMPTTYTGTFNLGEFMFNIFPERAGQGAQEEARDTVKRILEILYVNANFYFKKLLDEYVRYTNNTFAHKLIVWGGLSIGKAEESSITTGANYDLEP